MDDEVWERRPVSMPIEPSAETLSGFRTLDKRAHYPLGARRVEASRRDRKE